MERIYKAIEGVWSDEVGDYEPLGFRELKPSIGRYLISYDEISVVGTVNSVVEEFNEFRVLSIIDFNTLSKLKISGSISNLYNGIYIDNSIEILLGCVSRRLREQARNLINSKGVTNYSVCPSVMDSIHFGSRELVMWFDGARVPYSIRVNSELEFIVEHGHKSPEDENGALDVKKTFYI